MKKCDYGCGQDALFYGKQNKRWRCSKSPNSCPAKKALTKKNMITIYGVDNAGQLPQSIDKAKNKSETHKRKINEHLKGLASNPDVIAKRKATNQSRYGGNSPTM